MDYPKDNIEFQKQWSSCAGRRSGLETAIQLLETMCGQFFNQGKDEVAGQFRLANRRLKEFGDVESAKLDGFIKESLVRHVS